MRVAAMPVGGSGQGRGLSVGRCHDLRVGAAALLLLLLTAWPALGELPLFKPTYNMQQSTIAMPCNYTGFLDMSGDIGRFGIIDFDWSNAKEVWANAHPMDAEELLLDQAKRRKAAICPASCPYPAGCADKAACPQAKTWVYRNFVKALPWYSSVREKLSDPAYSGWFLQFNPRNTTPYAVPPCDANYSPPKVRAHGGATAPRRHGAQVSEAAAASPRQPRQPDPGRPAGVLGACGAPMPTSARARCHLPPAWRGVTLPAPHLAVHRAASATATGRADQALGGLFGDFPQGLIGN